MGKYALRTLVCVYLLFLLILPIGLIGYRTLANGWGPIWTVLTSEDFVSALKVTVEVALWAVVLNTIFGVAVSLVLTRTRFPGKRLLSALIDLPLAVSPVVVGLSFILVYGKFAPAGGWFERHGIQIIFALPGMVLVTVFVSLPLVVRAIVPLLEELGEEQEQAAHTLGASRWTAFRRITFPSIRWALVYGVVLCLARALGEFGAIAVVSGSIVDKTQTMTLYVLQEHNNFDDTGAYVAATALALIAVLALLLTKLVRPRSPQTKDSV